MMLNKILIVFALATYGPRKIYAFPPQIYNQNYKPHSFNYKSIYYYTSHKPALNPTYEDEVTITPIQTDYRDDDRFSYRSIQYAPLMSSSEDHVINEEEKKDMVPTITEINLINSVTNRSNIEPRLEVNQKAIAESRTTIVYGHNIHVPKLDNFSPAFNTLQGEKNDYTTNESVKQVVYANPLIFNYETKYQTEQTPKDIDNNAINNRWMLTKPAVSEDLYPVLTKQYKKSESLFTRRVLHEKESPVLQPQLIHARPYRLHLNTARAYNNIHVPLKSMLINKILPPCKKFNKLESAHLDVPSNKQTKVIAIHNNCVYRRL